MAAPSKAIGQTFAYAAAGTESHFSSSEYYTTIVVDNATPVALNVATDGGTAVAGAGTNMLTVPPNSIAEFGNLQPLPNADVPGTNYTARTGWTAQQGYLGTTLTFCSVIPQASTSGEVTISFQ
jgi:hypothetical protein